MFCQNGLLCLFGGFGVLLGPFTHVGVRPLGIGLERLDEDFMKHAPIIPQLLLILRGQHLSVRHKAEGRRLTNANVPVNHALADGVL